jgi:transcriptional regulator with XRE-family HTH domain
MTDTAASGPSLRRCRESAGLSREVLAERSNLSVRALRNLERGLTGAPHLGSLHKHADALALARARQAWQQALAIPEDLQHPGAGQVRAKLASTDGQASQNSSA